MKRRVLCIIMSLVMMIGGAIAVLPARVFAEDLPAYHEAVPQYTAATEDIPSPEPVYVPASALAFDPDNSTTWPDLTYYFLSEDDTPAAAEPEAVNIATFSIAPADFTTETLTIPTFDFELTVVTRVHDLPRSNRSDRTELGFILPPNTSFRVRQVNPSFIGVDNWGGTPANNGNLTLDLWARQGARRRLDNVVPNDGQWHTIQGTAFYTVPFVRTPYLMQGFTEAPIIEFEIPHNAMVLPVYRYTDSRSWAPQYRDFTTHAAWDAWDTVEARVAYIDFMSRWTTEPYALISGNSINLFVSDVDRPHLEYMFHFSTLDQMLGFYDHFTSVADYWIGFDPYFEYGRNVSGYWTDAELRNPSRYHAAPAARYLAVPNAGGAGSGYWAGHYMAETSGPHPGTVHGINQALAPGMDIGLAGPAMINPDTGNPFSSLPSLGIHRMYLRRGWAALHEIGHSYQGAFLRGGNVSVGEVWINIIGHFYQDRYILPTHPLVPHPWNRTDAYARDPHGAWFSDGNRDYETWQEIRTYDARNFLGMEIRSAMFWDHTNRDGERGRHIAEPHFHNRRVNLGFTYLNPANPALQMNFTDQLYMWVVMLEAIEFDYTFRRFHQELRERFYHNWENIRTWQQGDVFTYLFSYISGYNLVPYFEAYGITISDHVRVRLDAHGIDNALHVLYDMVADPALRDLIVSEYDHLVSHFGLVSEATLRRHGITGSVEIHISIDNIAEIEGRYVILMEGVHERARQQISSSGIVSFNNLDAGAYSVIFPNGRTRGYFVPSDSFLLSQRPTPRRYVEYGSITGCMMNIHRINIMGLNDGLFATVTPEMSAGERGVLKIEGRSMVPNPATGIGRYAEITVFNASGTEVFSRLFTGNMPAEQVAAVNDVIPIGVGYRIHIWHAANGGGTSYSPHGRVISFDPYFSMRTGLDVRGANNNFGIAAYVGLVRLNAPVPPQPPSPSTPQDAVAMFENSIINFGNHLLSEIDPSDFPNMRVRGLDRNLLFAAIMELPQIRRMAVARTFIPLLITDWEIVSDADFATLASLTVTSGGDVLELTPVFDPFVNLYTVSVPGNVNTMTIEATSTTPGATVLGLGTMNLSFGSNTFDVIARSSNIMDNPYTIVVTREADQASIVSPRTPQVPTISRQPLNQATNVNVGVNLRVDVLTAYNPGRQNNITVRWFEAPNATTYPIGNPPLLGTGNSLFLIPNTPGIRYFFAEIENYDPTVSGRNPIDRVTTRSRIVAVETTAIPTARVADMVSVYGSQVFGNAVSAITNEALFHVNLIASSGSTWALYSDPNLTNPIGNTLALPSYGSAATAFAKVTNGGAESVYVINVARERIVTPDDNDPLAWTWERNNFAQNSRTFEPTSGIVTVDFDVTMHTPVGPQGLQLVVQGTGGSNPSGYFSGDVHGLLRVSNIAGSPLVDIFDGPARNGGDGTGSGWTSNRANNSAPLQIDIPTPIRMVMDLDRQAYKVFVDNQDVFTTGWAGWRIGTGHTGAVLSDISRIHIGGQDHDASGGVNSAALLSVDNFRVTQLNARDEVVQIPVFFLDANGNLHLNPDGTPVISYVEWNLNTPAVIQDWDIEAVYCSVTSQPFSIFGFDPILVPRVTRATTITANAVVGGSPEAAPNAAINFTSEVLTGFAPSGLYRFMILGHFTPAFHIANENGEIDIDAEWIGQTIDIVKRGDGGQGMVDSPPQRLIIPARPTPPNSAGISSPDGSRQINGLTTAMEFRLTGEADWIAVTGTTATVEQFGLYHVRYIATATSFASNYIEVIVVPAAPTGLRVREVSSFYAILEWDTPGEGASFIVRYTHNDVAREIAISPDMSYVQVIPLAMNTAYTFRVFGYFEGTVSAAYASITAITTGRDHTPPINFSWASVGDTVQPDGTLGGRPHYSFRVNGDPQYNYHSVQQIGSANVIEVTSRAGASQPIFNYYFPAISSGVFEFGTRVHIEPMFMGIANIYSGIHLIGNTAALENIPVISVLNEVIDNTVVFSYEVSNVAPNINPAGGGRPVRVVSQDREWVEIRMIVDMDRQLVTILIDDEILVRETGFRFRTGTALASPVSHQVLEITGFQLRTRNGLESQFSATDFYVTPQHLRNDSVVVENNLLVIEGTVVTVAYDNRHIGNLTFAATVNGVPVFLTQTGHSSAQFIVQEDHIGGELRVVVTSTYELGIAVGYASLSATDMCNVCEEEPCICDIVNLTALQELVDYVNELDMTEFTEESWDALVADLIAAEFVLADTNANQGQVDAAYTNLKASLSALVRVQVTDDLDTAIAYAQALTLSNFTPMSWMNLQNELINAIAIRDNPAMTQAHRDNAAANLQAAIEALAQVPAGPDRSALIAAIDYAESLTMQDFSIMNWMNLQNELGMARLINNNPNANQTQIDNVAASLNAAINLRIAAAPTA